MKFEAKMRGEEVSGSDSEVSDDSDFEKTFAGYDDPTDEANKQLDELARINEEQKKERRELEKQKKAQEKKEKKAEE